MLPGYTVGRVVGEGGFCQVRLAVHRASRRRVAVKVVDTAKAGAAAGGGGAAGAAAGGDDAAGEARRALREVRVLRRLGGHACVVKLFDAVEDAPRGRLHLVMEYAAGGSLLDHVRARRRLGEPEAAHLLQQLASALAYCHANDVVHRDVKLENVLLDGRGGAKLIDFGLAAFFAPGRRLRVHCGSPSYAAPEIVARRAYEGPPVDVWSLGVVLFAALAGHLPFHSPTGDKRELCARILAGGYAAPEWLSPGARDLLGRMLTVDPERRATLREVAAHAWTRGAGPRWERPPSVFAVSVDAATGAVTGADEGALAELERLGHGRAETLRQLAAGEVGPAVACYCLLAEARAEAAARLSPRPVFAPAAAAAAAANPAPAPASGSGAAADSRRPATPSHHHHQQQPVPVPVPGAARPAGAAATAATAAVRPQTPVIAVS